MHCLILVQPYCITNYAASSLSSLPAVLQDSESVLCVRVYSLHVCRLYLRWHIHELTCERAHSQGWLLIADISCVSDAAAFCLFAFHYRNWIVAPSRYCLRCKRTCWQRCIPGSGGLCIFISTWMSGAKTAKLLPCDDTYRAPRYLAPPLLPKVFKWKVQKVFCATGSETLCSKLDLCAGNFHAEENWLPRGTSGVALLPAAWAHANIHPNHHATPKSLPGRSAGNCIMIEPIEPDKQRCKNICGMIPNAYIIVFDDEKLKEKISRVCIFNGSQCDRLC